jgi:hypothetical protein
VLGLDEEATMSDGRDKLEAAQAKAADYDRLATIEADAEKREEYRARAKFYRDIVDELRAELSERHAA